MTKETSNQDVIGAQRSKWEVEKNFCLQQITLLGVVIIMFFFFVCLFLFFKEIPN